MFDDPLVRRLAVSKTLGLLIGLIGFVSLPWFWPEAPATLRWGFMLWYLTMGAVVGLVGVFDWHPLLRIPLPWWVRGAIMGGWMNLVLVLLMYPQLVELLASFMAPRPPFENPLWMVVEGAVVGLLIDGVATRFAGDGRALIDN